ncbi:unnamed protein product [Closterium sp. NIES-53]
MRQRFGSGVRLPLSAIFPRASSLLALFAPTDAPGWQFYHPATRRVLFSHDVTFDESVCFPHRSSLVLPRPPAPLPGSMLPPDPSGLAEGDDPAADDTAATRRPLRLETPPGFPSRPSSPTLQPVAVDFGASPGGGDAVGAGSRGAGSGGADLEGVVSGGAERSSGGGVEGTTAGGSAGALQPLPRRPLLWEQQQLSLPLPVSVAGGSGGTGTRGVGGSGAGGTGNGGAIGAGAGGTGGTRASGIGAGDARGTGAGGSGVGDVGDGGTGGSVAGGGPGTSTRGVGSGGSLSSVCLLRAVYRWYYSSSTCSAPDLSQTQLPPDSPLPTPSRYTPLTDPLTERREPESRPASLVARTRHARRVHPPPVPDEHTMALRPSSVAQRPDLPSPPVSSLPDVPEHVSDLACAASPTISCCLATLVTDPTFSSDAASALVAELVAFDYFASLISNSACPPFVGGELAFGCDILEDRHVELECLAAPVPHRAAMVLAPERDPDALDIPTLRFYAEAIMGQ